MACQKIVQVISAWNEFMGKSDELPKVRLFACSVTVHPQCLMQGLAWRKLWASIYETTVEELSVKGWGVKVGLMPSGDVALPDGG